MALRDHFRSPLDDQRHWEGFHATWPVMIVSLLRGRLPSGYFAEPRVHSGSSAEIDVATFEKEGEGALAAGNGNDAGGVATDVYEVLVYDEKRRCRLVAAVEIVSPANKDRPEHRRTFAAKCVALLREHVSVVIVDIVTTRSANLYGEMLNLIGQSDPALLPQAPSVYASAIRLRKQAEEWLLDSWLQRLALGTALPTMPLWLADDLALPLELEDSYEQSCSLLNIPSSI